MSACHTCKSLDRDMPQRVVVLVNGSTYTQSIPSDPALKAEALIKAANYLIGLAEQCRTEGTQRG